MRNAVLLVLLTAGCTAGMARGMGILVPGHGVTPAMQTMYCGTPEAFDHLVGEARARVKAGGSQQARVGMSACEVLALLGAPNDSRTVEVAGAEPSAHWTYLEAEPGRRQQAARLVVIVPGPTRRGVVESVVW